MVISPRFANEKRKGLRVLHKKGWALEKAKSVVPKLKSTGRSEIWEEEMSLWLGWEPRKGEPQRCSRIIA